MLTAADVDVCEGLGDAVRALASFSSLDRSVMIRGDTMTARIVAPRLLASAPRAVLHEVQCPLVSTIPRGLLGFVSDSKERLMQPGLLLFSEVNHLADPDQRLLAVLARDRVLDAYGTRVKARLVCQHDPRRGQFDATLGVFLDVDIPPLVARSCDAVTLLARWISRLVAEPVRLDNLAVEAITEYPWPGDMSELATCAERIAGSWIGPRKLALSAADLGLPHATGPMRRARTQATGGRTLGAMMEEYEAEIIQLVMTRFGGNKSQAARDLGISRSYLIQKCQKYGID